MTGVGRWQGQGRPHTTEIWWRTLLHITTEFSLKAIKLCDIFIAKPSRNTYSYGRPFNLSKFVDNSTNTKTTIFVMVFFMIFCVAIFVVVFVVVFVIIIIHTCVHLCTHTKKDIATFRLNQYGRLWTCLVVILKYFCKKKKIPNIQPPSKLPLLSLLFLLLLLLLKPSGSTSTTVTQVTVN